MAEKLNREAHSQSSELAREKDLQKLVEDGGNNAYSNISMAGSVVTGKFVFVERNLLSLAIAQLILTLGSDYFFAVEKILLFSLWKFRVLPKF